MRGIFRIIVVLFLFVGFLELVQPASAICCGYYSCTKTQGETVVDDFLAPCGGASCSGSCPAGYSQSNNCYVTAGTATSCGAAETGGGDCANTGWTSATNWRCEGFCSNQADCKKGGTSGSCKCVGGVYCTDSAPTSPNLVSPANGYQSPSLTVTMQWSAPSSWGTRCAGNVNTYRVYGGTTNPPSELWTTVASTTTSYQRTFALADGQTYYWQVIASNGALVGFSAVRSFTLPINNTVSGTVYLDTNNNCSTATPWTLGGLTATLRDTGYSAAVGALGTYSMSVGSDPSYPYLDLSGIPAGYNCSTAPGCNSCPTITSVASPPGVGNFFLTLSREPWWQVVGGSIYVGENIRSEMPSGENLIVPGSGGSYGALMQASGTRDFGAGTVSTAGYAAQTRYRGKTMNYDYFSAHMGVLGNTPNDWVVNTLSKPVNNPDKTFYYMEPTTGEASVSTPWTVANGESYVILINGDLRIASNITVDPGGFLAFIVSGAIRVSPAVTTVQGLYVSDGTLVTESNGGTDVAANFEGSIVSWGGVNFGRDLEDSNITTPAESFTYRPDLLTNMPEAMKGFALRWEEVVPGTFGQ